MATVVEDVKIDDEVKVVKAGEEVLIKALEDIPAYHKIALKDMEKGENVIKYGQIIGAMTQSAKSGNWISHKNIMS